MGAFAENKNDLPSDLLTMAEVFRWIIRADYADEGPLGRLSEEALTAVAEALEAATDVVLYEPSNSRWVQALRRAMAKADRLR